MQITTTAKIQIYVNREQQILLDKTLEAYRIACDYTAGHMFQTHDLKQYSLNQRRN